MSLARVIFDQVEVRVLSPGDFLICAQTGKPVPLKRMRYWNVERQEAYIDAAAATARHESLREGI